MENPWELARHEDAPMVRFYGNTQRHTDESGDTRVEWVNARQVIGLPFDSFITCGSYRLAPVNAQND